MIFDMVWLDDEFLVSGGKDTKMALWRVPQFKRFCPTTTHYMEPLVVKTVKNADRVRSLVFNRSLNEIVALTLNGFIHVWKTEEFRQVRILNTRSIMYIFNYLSRFQVTFICII